MKILKYFRKLFGENMKIIEDNNHYHDTGTNANNLINEQTTNERSIKGNAEPVGPAADEEDYSNEIRQITNNYNELIKDRRSFYDNQWTAVASSDDVKLYKSEKSIDINADDVNKSSSKHERDDFDDLVDMTHRVPRKLLKKETATTVQNSNENVYYPMNGYSSRKHANKSSSSSLPPLPPLPYSFVKLEKSKLSASNSSTSLNSNSSKSTYVKSSSDTRGKQSTTRLIIPINKDYQLTTPFSANEPKTAAVLTENTNRIPQEEINIEIFEPAIKNNNKNTLNHPIKCSSVNYNDNRSCNNNVTNRKNCSHANGNDNSNSNSSSSSVSQSNANVRLIFTDGGAGGSGGGGVGSQLMTNLDKNSATSFSNSSEEDICDESEIISNANSNTSATNSTNNTNTTNMNINNNANHQHQHQHYVQCAALNGSNLNAKKDNNNHLIVKSKPKSSDIINSEWDQVELFTNC